MNSNRNSERVNKPIKVDLVDKSTDQVSHPLIDFLDSAVAPMSEDSSNDPEQNRNSLLESFDSDNNIVVCPESVQNKSSKMEMSNWSESLNITEMIEQAPSIRDYSTKG